MDVGGEEEKPGSLTLSGAVSLGTGVMIGAGIFALTGQVAELAGDLFPIALLAAALVVAASAYSYVKLSNSMPSSGGIAMFLKEEYGLGVATGVFSMFMYFSMVINESLVARTFGAYTLQVIDLGRPTFWVPALGVVLLATAFVINLSGNRIVQIAEGSMAAAGSSTPIATSAAPSSSRSASAPRCTSSSLLRSASLRSSPVSVG